MSYLETARKTPASLRDEKKNLNPAPRTRAATALAEFQPDEANRIVATWREILRISLDPERVREHLRKLREWQAQLTKIH